MSRSPRAIPWSCGRDRRSTRPVDTSITAAARSKRPASSSRTGSSTSGMRHRTVSMEASTPAGCSPTANAGGSRGFTTSPRPHRGTLRTGLHRGRRRWPHRHQRTGYGPRRHPLESFHRRPAPTRERCRSGTAPPRLPRQDTSISTFPVFSPTPPSITFSHQSNLRAAADFALDPAGEPAGLRADRLDRVVLSPDLLGDEGFGSLIVEKPRWKRHRAQGRLPRRRRGRHGSIDRLQPHPQRTGHRARRGTLLRRLQPIPRLGQRRRREPGQAPVAPGRGRLVVGSDAVLSTAGLLVDDRAGSNELLPVAIHGGTISLSGFSVALRPGSKVDVSGGARLTTLVIPGFDLAIRPAPLSDFNGGKRLGTTGQVSYGNAGTISIAAGRDQNIGELFGGSLSLGGSLLGASGAQAERSTCRLSPSRSAETPRPTT